MRRDTLMAFTVPWCMGGLHDCVGGGAKRRNLPGSTRYCLPGQNFIGPGCVFGIHGHSRGPRTRKATEGSIPAKIVFGCAVWLENAVLDCALKKPKQPIAAIKHLNACVTGGGAGPSLPTPGWRTIALHLVMKEGPRNHRDYRK